MIELCSMLLAQAPVGPPAPGGTAAPASPMGPSVFLALMMAMVVFMMLSARSRKKREKRKRDDMYAGMSKGDRVLTIGGVVATVISVKDDEVVLKVDESTNTKMVFIKSAIQRVLGDDSLKSIE